MTAPLPEPPDVVSVSGVPQVPLVEVTVRVAWSAEMTVKSCEVIEASMESVVSAALIETVPSATPVAVTV